MTRRVVRSDLAGDDLAESLSYLDERNPAAAEKLAVAIDRRCQRLATQPFTGRARDELRPGLRSVVVDRYVVFYRVHAAAVEIVRILHGSRDIDTLFADGTYD